MSELPKRDDPIYKEIEGFEDYELTNCIAYEMAIRNEEFLKLSKRINNDYLNFIEIKDEFEFFGFEPHNLPFLLSNMLKVDSNNKGRIYSATRLRNTSQNLNTISNYAISNNLIYKMDLENNKKENVKLSFETLTEKYKHPLDSIMYAIKIGESYIPLNGIHNGNVSTFDKKLIEQLDLKNYNLKVGISSYRPELVNPLKKEVTIDINLALPKDELIAYISKLKDTYDKDNSIIKMPLELISEDLEKSDNNHIQKKPKAEKYADWFYIYDCYQILKADDKKKSNETIYNEIDNLLGEHYDSINKHYYSIETYKKTIMKNMNYLIDELGYKELITGINNK